MSHVPTPPPIEPSPIERLASLERRCRQLVAGLVVVGGLVLATFALIAAAWFHASDLTVDGTVTAREFVVRGADGNESIQLVDEGEDGPHFRMGRPGASISLYLLGDAFPLAEFHSGSTAAYLQVFDQSAVINLETPTSNLSLAAAKDTAGTFMKSGDDSIDARPDGIAINRANRRRAFLGINSANQSVLEKADP